MENDPMPATPAATRLTALLVLTALALSGTAAMARSGKGPDWVAARSAFESAPPLGLDEAAFFACSASWGLWSEALEAGKVAVPTAALPPALLDPKAGETAADWGIYLIDSDEALELHKAVERQLAPELARVLAGDAKAARSWFARLGTCKVPD